MTHKSIDEAVAELANTKAEHRPLVETIAGDAGMDPATRRELLTHLYEEEEEHMAEIQAALGAAGAAAAAPAAGPPSGKGLTVGCLQAQHQQPGADPRVLGSLRRPV